MTTTQAFQTLAKLSSCYDEITVKNIRAALLSLSSYNRKLNPLADLVIVDDLLKNQFFPRNAYGRHMALIEILTSIITEQLHHHRKVMGTPCQPPDTTLSEAFHAIKCDAKTNNRQLIGWSWIYYGFVRIDLGVMQDTYTKKACLDGRTLRRYQEATLSRIVDLLIEKEIAARRSHAFSSEAVIRNELKQDEITITLKAETVRQIIRSDPALLYALAEWLHRTGMSEIGSLITDASDEPLGGWQLYAERVLGSRW